MSTRDINQLEHAKRRRVGRNHVTGKQWEESRMFHLEMSEGKCRYFQQPQGSGIKPTRS